MPLQASSSQPADPQLEAKILQIIRDNPEVVFESIAAYQQKKQEQQQQAQKAFLENMKTNPRLVIGESPTTGASEQKIVLIKFSDFQCPACAEGYQTLKKFMAKHQERVTLVYKHLPLTEIHPEAMPAAKASWAAQEQGKFWEFHNILFKNQEKLGNAFYIETAKSLNLDIDKFNKDRNSDAANTAIQKDIQMADELGFDATPTMAINGQLVSEAGQLAELEELLSGVSN